MITNETILDFQTEELKLLNIPFEKCLFFDIETTGLSWKNSYIYLLGTVYYDGLSWKKILWFSQHPSDEKEILSKFSQLLYEKKYVIHFNGKTFDVPYLMHKYNFYQMEQSWDDIIQIDLYQKVLPFKKMLHLEHVKQKDLERLIGLYREDPYSGKELIAFYKEYLCSGDKKLEEMLLLHNSEDIDGMLALLPLVCMLQIFQGEFPTYLASAIQTEITEHQVTLRGSWNTSFPLDLQLDTEFYQITCTADFFTITIPIYQGTLKYFFTDYKNYYYLKYEDEAIHKSIGAYVDKEYRENAKACNCYKKVTGSFLPQFTTLYEPVFLENYKDTFSRFEIKEDFIMNQEELKVYASHLFQMCPKLSSN